MRFPTFAGARSAQRRLPKPPPVETEGSITRWNGFRHRAKGGSTARVPDHGHRVAREAVWILSSCFIATSVVFMNRVSWSISHEIVQRSGAASVRAAAAIVGLLYGGGCAARGLRRVFRRRHRYGQFNA